VPSWRGELEITEAIQWLIDNGRKVRSTTITGYWKDTGNVDDMLEVNRMVLEGVEPAQHGTVDASTEIIGRVVIEHDAEVEASLIGHDVEVTPAPKVPKAHRLVLGDHSKVQISS
jgi:glucose-1-phosphate thymidylyltransferase